jgi:PAS domain S-box-containing protein
MTEQEFELYYFLEDGGEMGELTRSYDWSKTPVGTFERWPQSLRTTVGIILHSDFPMFLWWGNDMTQFYNDAYRPSLGNNGKHPKALGQPARECWPEIWEIIYPLIEQVRTTAKSFFSENQLVPIYRNGKIEDVYWTFSYSAVFGDTGNIDGVLVVCNETTKQVSALKELTAKQGQLEQSERHLHNVFNQVNAGIAQTDSEGNFLQVNDRYCMITGFTKRELYHQNIISITHPDDKERSLRMLRDCIDNKKNFFIEKRYIKKDGSTVWVNKSGSLVTGTRGERILAVVTIDITERKKQEQIIQDLLRAEHDAREAVENERQKFEDLLIQAPAAIAVMSGPEHVFTLANPPYMQLVGIGRDIIGKSVRDALPEIDRLGFYELLDSVYASGIPFRGDEMLVTLDRKKAGRPEEVFVNFVYQPLFDDKGSVDGILVHAVEVTDQVSARKKVEESELQFRNLVLEATVATAVYVGTDMKIQLANDAMLQLWGKTDSVIGMPIRKALPELEGQPFYQLLEEVLATGTTYWGKEDRADLVVDGVLKTGYFNFTYKPLKNSKGEIYGVLNMALDVTDQVLARRQVEQSEANLRNVILQAPVAMCLFKGPKHRVEIVNDRMLEIFGKPAEMIMKRPIVKGLPEVRGQGFEELLDNVFKTGETFTAYGVPAILPRDGKAKTVYVNFVYEAYRDGDGKISGIMTVATDVTEQVIARQKIEELIADRTRELEIANLNLQKSNAELSQFAYITSHDLQEPARKISTFVEILTRSLGENVDHRSKAYLTKIERSATRMLSLIRDVLSFSRLNKESRAFSSVDLNTVLDAVKGDFELLIEEKQCIIESNVLPVIEAIPVQMSQLFGNLISNALKFSSTTTVPMISVTADFLSPEEFDLHPELTGGIPHYKISFKDNGIGFNQANADQIFNIFQRLHSRTEYEGTGIGLAMCKKITENHNGNIYALSSPGNGATFVVLLPSIQS